MHRIVRWKKDQVKLVVKLEKGIILGAKFTRPEPRNKFWTYILLSCLTISIAWSGTCQRVVHSLLTGLSGLICFSCPGSSTPTYKVSNQNQSHHNGDEQEESAKMWFQSSFTMLQCFISFWLNIFLWRNLAKLHNLFNHLWNLCILHNFSKLAGGILTNLHRNVVTKMQLLPYSHILS